MTAGEFREKFDDCVGAMLSAETAGVLFEQLSNLSVVRNLRELALTDKRQRLAG
jgi:hypothetical protein